MPLPRALATLCVPTFFSTLVTILYNIADTFFVGMLNDPVQTAAVTLAGTVLLAFYAVNNLFGVGASSLLSRSLGARNLETARKASAFGFYCSLGSGILFSVLCFGFQGQLLDLLGADQSTRAATSDYMFWAVYLGAAPVILSVVMAYLVRAEGAAFHASIGTMGGCILNIVLDPFCIMPWGLGMGAAGAGFATFVSNCASCAYFLALFYVKREDSIVSVRPSDFTLDPSVVKQVFYVGVPSAIQNLLNVVGMLVLNNLSASYGVDAVSAMGIAKKVDMVPLYIALGFSQGIMPLVSYTYASKRYRRMKDAIVLSFKVIMPIQVVGTALYFLGAEPLMRLFIDTDAVVVYGTFFLRALSFSLPFVAFDYVCVGIFQALGDGKGPFVIALLRKGVLDIPLMFGLNALFGLFGIAFSQVIAEGALSVVELFLLRRVFADCVED